MAVPTSSPVPTSLRRDHLAHASNKINALNNRSARFSSFLRGNGKMLYRAECLPIPEDARQLHRGKTHTKEMAIIHMIVAKSLKQSHNM